MSFTAITDFIPPATIGSSRMLYSPELFDTATGAYPKSPLPTIATYPADINGRIPFFQGFRANRIWPFFDDDAAGAVYDEQALNPPDGHETDPPPVGYTTSKEFTGSTSYSGQEGDPPDTFLQETIFTFQENNSVISLVSNIVFDSLAGADAAYGGFDTGGIGANISAQLLYSISGGLWQFLTILSSAVVVDTWAGGPDPGIHQLIQYPTKTLLLGAISNGGGLFNLQDLRLKIKIQGQAGAGDGSASSWTQVNVYALYLTF